MEIVSRAEFERRLPEMLREMRGGRVFVYPTDTIYGIGCDATNQAAVEQVRLLKKRAEKPFSVIVPSVRWIMLNCEVGHVERKWIRKLPGPYTLIMRLADRAAIATAVNGGIDTIGVRIPAIWFSGAVAHSGVPFVTTSVNVTGQPHMTSLADIDPAIREGADYIVDVGELRNRPSKVVDLISGSAVRE
jgi:L-threonylcarbamoyladenylate synthase